LLIFPFGRGPGEGERRDSATVVFYPYLPAVRSNKQRGQTG